MIDKSIDYNVGIYIRLSREDDDKTLESESITNQRSLLLQYVKENVVNVLLLDIDLKSSMSGLDLASEIRKTNKHSYIIFTSAHLEYILIAYQYKTFDFIPKPITLERLEETFLRIIDDINSDYTGTKFIHIDNKNTIISQDWR